MSDENNLVIEKSEYSHQINDNDEVIRTDLGRYSKITFVANSNKSNSIKKLNKYEYVDICTGEIKQYNLDKPTSKADVNRKLKKYEEIVLYNFTGGASELFVTLTCSQHITDIADIKQYYNNFIDNIKQDYQDIDYIGLFEQTELGCWHIHLFIKNNQHKKLYVPHQQLLNYWQQGAVYVMPNKNTFQTLGHSKNKRDDRLERFRHFPKGEKLYHRSKGIKTPKKEKMTYKDCPEYNSNNHTRVSSKTYHIRNQNNDKVVNTIATEMYKQMPVNSSQQAPVESQDQVQEEINVNDNETPLTPVLEQAQELTEKEIKIRQLIERSNSPNNRIYYEFI